MMIRAHWPNSLSFYAALCAVVLCCRMGHGETPLYEQSAYDQITLDEHNEGAVITVSPLKFPGRRVPYPKPKSGKLKVRLLEKPDAEYELLWNSIEEIELFNDLVLKKTSELVRTGRLEEAYDYLEFLLADDPTLPGLDRGIEDYLYEEAKASQRQGQFEDSLAMLRELYDRNAKRDGLDNAMGLVTEKLVARYVEADNYWTARQMLRNLAALYPEHAMLAKWEGQFERDATQLLADGREAEKAGRLRDAHGARRRLMHVWPKLAGGKAFIDSMQKQYPRVVVGVSLPGTAGGPGLLHDWAARRSNRLVCRTLMEFVGRSSEGGEYSCPVGIMQIEELGLRLAFQVLPDRCRSVGAPSLTGYGLARQLWAMGDPADSAYRLDWAELLGQVSVENVYLVDADLRRPHVRPEALLRTVVVGPGGESSSSGGPYVVESRSEEETVYTADPNYSPEASQPKEIVEQYLRKATRAIMALERRQVDVLDRINPWDLEQIRSLKGMKVERYAAPTVHCLIPNLNKPFTSRREFRRALVYGIHREAILTHLLRGQPLAGCQVISGPFSPGMSRDDPLDYGYDRAIEPREYQPQLAIALAQVALSEVANRMEKEGVELSDIPELVLAHPAHEIARVASTSIQRQLRLVDIPVALRELPAGLPARMPDDVDLLYAEVAMWEPVVDARRLLDAGGIAGGSSVFMSQALRQLDQATDWTQVADRLRHIHWLAHREVSIVPLWQLTDHFAYHESLEGVGSEPVTLYQNVESWQPATHFAAEEK